MAFTVEAWNVQNGLGKSGVSQEIVETVLSHESDLVVFGEATDDIDNDDFLAAAKKLNYEGYLAKFVAYDDSDVRTDSHGLLVATRLPGPVHSGRIATRNAIRVGVIDPATNTQVTWAAVHLDDRLETTRRAQAAAIFDTGLLPADGPRGIAGDLNTVPRSRKWCPSPALADRLPVTTVHPDSRVAVFNKVARAYSVGSRAMRMASGRTLVDLQERGFQDVDDAHRPTMPAHNPKFQLDHILISDELHASEFTRYQHGGLSDHLAISAKIET